MSDRGGQKARKVLLINPPRFHELIGKNPAVLEKHRGFNPPLGLLQLARYVESNSQHKVDVLDCQPPGWNYDELVRVLGRRLDGVDVVGMTAMTFTLLDVVKTARLVKRLRPGCRSVLGGPHTLLFADETLKFEGVDALVIGDGEIPFLGLLDALDDPALMRGVPGLAYRGPDGQAIKTGLAPVAADLDPFGWPDRKKINLDDYSSLIGQSGKITTIMSSRGCPYRCTFCDRQYSPVLSRFRWRSARHVADEIEECLSLGIEEALFYDDTFTVRKDRVYELCDQIRRRKLKFRWDVRAHVNTVDLEILKAMRQAGCVRIHFGVESGNDRMLRVIRKNTTVARVRRAFGWAKEARMEVLAYFMIGQQTETASDIADTMRLARSLDPDYTHFTVFCPYPGTGIYAEGLRRGIIRRDVWKEFAAGPRTGFELPVWEEHFTREELQKLLVQCYRSFYIRPGYFWKRLRRIRNAGELRRKVRAGLGVFRMKPGETLAVPRKAGGHDA